MNDARTLADIEAICAEGRIVAVWHPDMIGRLARLNQRALAEAKRRINLRFGREVSPFALSEAIREHRAGWLQSLRPNDSINSANSNNKICPGLSPFARIAAIFARRGGMARGPKGFATMDPARAAEIRKKAMEGRLAYCRRMAAAAQTAQSSACAAD